MFGRSRSTLSSLLWRHSSRQISTYSLSKPGMHTVFYYWSVRSAESPEYVLRLHHLFEIGMHPIFSRVSANTHAHICTFCMHKTLAHNRAHTEHRVYNNAQTTQQLHTQTRTHYAHERCVFTDRESIHNSFIRNGHTTQTHTHSHTQSHTQTLKQNPHIDTRTQTRTDRRAHVTLTSNAIKLHRGILQ